MPNAYRLGFLLIMCLCSTSSSGEQRLTGTKGQNFDRLVFELSTDDEVKVSAKIMTINRYPNSSSTIVVTDNGVAALGPASDSAERWSRTIAIKGKGKHEIVMICSNSNSDPVHCVLSTNDARVSLLN